jgi:hypothetical protein
MAEARNTNFGGEAALDDRPDGVPHYIWRFALIGVAAICAVKKQAFSWVVELVSDPQAEETDFICTPRPDTNRELYRPVGKDILDQLSMTKQRALLVYGTCDEVTQGGFFALLAPLLTCMHTLPPKGTSRSTGIHGFQSQENKTDRLRVCIAIGINLEKSMDIPFIYANSLRKDENDQPGEPVHHVLYLMDNNGAEWAVDLTGAQFGHCTLVEPWASYEARHIVPGSVEEGTCMSLDDPSLDGLMRPDELAAYNAHPGENGVYDQFDQWHLHQALIGSAEWVLQTGGNAERLFTCDDGEFMGLMDRVAEGFASGVELFYRNWYDDGMARAKRRAVVEERWVD